MVFWTIAGVIVLRAWGTGMSPDALWGPADNDDVMRLLSVRAWIGGQSWFDMTQYGVLATDGVSLHWSRFADLGPVALIHVFGLWMPAETAERAMALVWPTLLALSLHAIVGLGTRRVLGVGAALVAMGALATWPMVSSGYFAPGRLDHHNLQIVLMGLAGFAALWPTRPSRSGAVAGAALALSFAIGLEGLFFAAALASGLVLLAAFDAPQAPQRLSWFCPVFAGLTVAAHMAQTRPDAWLTEVCDTLGPGVLSLVVLGCLAGLSFHLLPAPMRRPGPILGLAALVLATGLALSWSWISPCFASPYAHLPQTLQTVIAEQLVEALSTPGFVARFPTLAVDLLWPLWAALGLGVLGLGLTRSDRWAPGVLVGLCLVGAVLSWVQVRQVVLLAAMAPALIGYGIATLVSWRRETGSALSGVALIGALALVFVPSLVDDAVLASPSKQPRGLASQDAACARPSTLSVLNALPPQAILTPLNLGPKLVLSTHHTGLSAPYHRSAEALGNGVLPFQGDADALVAILEQRAARLVLVCAGSVHGTDESIGSRLAASAPPEGFVPVPLDAGPLRLYLWSGP